MRIRTLWVVAALSLAAACSGAGADEPASEPDAAPETTTTTAPTTTTTAAPRPAPPISKLTGLLTDPAVLDRPVVAVKIDNVQGRSTPQAGINEADVVYEIQVEGQITRLLSLFQSAEASPVGPVRSARGSEIAILEELNRPIFVWHGANGILGPLVRNAAIVPRSIDDAPALYYRHPGRPMPYNSFIHGTGEARLTALEGPGTPTRPLFRFAEPGQAPSAGAVPASYVHIRFPPPFGYGGGEAPVSYKWDGATWRRDQAGRNHVDASGRQVAVQNVIVRFTPAVDSGTVDSAGTRVPTANMVGSGEVWVFSQGTVTTGTWTKPDNATPTKYLDQQGKQIKLTPGKTWISLPYAKGGSTFG